MVQLYVKIVRQAQVLGDVQTHFHTATRRAGFEEELRRYRIELSCKSRPYAGVTDVLLPTMAVAGSTLCVVSETPAHPSFKLDKERQVVGPGPGSSGAHTCVFSCIQCKRLLSILRMKGCQYINAER